MWLANRQLLHTAGEATTYLEVASGGAHSASTVSLAVNWAFK